MEELSEVDIDTLPKSPVDIEQSDVTKKMKNLKPKLINNKNKFKKEEDIDEE
jgi:hypothetical protein